MVSRVYLDNDDNGLVVNVDSDELGTEEDWDDVEDVELPETYPTAEAVDRTSRLCEFTFRGVFWAKVANLNPSGPTRAPDLITSLGPLRKTATHCVYFFHSL